MLKKQIQADEPIVSFDHAGIKLGDFMLHDMTFTIPMGYLIGLTGKNSAGKTTLMKMILGDHMKYTGSIKVAGLEVKENRQTILAYIGYISADNTFFMERTLIENADFYKRYYEEWDQDLYLQMLKRFKINIGTTLKWLSKGEFIKFQLAFALTHKPQLLILDEPTAGLDPVFRREFLQILQDVICSEKCSILLATHLHSDLEKIADYTIEISGNTSIWKPANKKSIGK